MNLLLLINFIYSQCYDHGSPLKFRTSLTSKPCEYEPLSKNINLNKGMVKDNNQTMVNIQLNCQSNSTICDLVSKAFSTAASYLENIIIFHQPIYVNASFYSFCKVNGQCNDSKVITLGQAGASRSIALDDDDGKRRLYPQALVKQLNLPKYPKFSSTDIIAEFNADAQFWFTGQGTMKSSQSDFLLVISHELIHGLGFSSSYADYFNSHPQALTPYPEILIDNNNQATFLGFTENAFDRYLYEVNNNQSLSLLTDNLNLFKGVNKQFSSQESIISEFSSSNQYKLAQDMLTLSTISNSIAFQTMNSTNNQVFLETSLKPFTALSSISHVSYSKYTNTQDFLMRYKTDNGDDLVNIIKKIGNWDSAPYGPNLVAMLGRLGYATNANPNPVINAKLASSASKIIPEMFIFIIMIFI